MEAILKIVAILPLALEPYRSCGVRVLQGGWDSSSGRVARE